MCAIVGLIYEFLYCTLGTNLKFHCSVIYNINKLFVVVVLI
jgi:hypothetical protein